MIALASLCLLLTPEVTPAQFKVLIDRAEKSDAAVPAALDALSEAAFRKGFDLKAYQKAVGDPEWPTSPKRLVIERARKGNIEVIVVTVGTCSRLRARDSKAGELAIPAFLRFIQGYDASPIFVGRSLVVIQTSVQDAGVRYAYRTAFLAPEEKGFRTLEKIAGRWTFSEDDSTHLSIKGSTVTLRTIDEPRAFFTANVDRLFRTTSTWDLSGERPRRKNLVKGDLEIRSIDQWIVAALATKRPTKNQLAFRKHWGTGRPMITGYRISLRHGGGEATLDFDARFRFSVRTGGGDVSFLGASEL